MPRIASILLPLPLPEAFDYAEPEGMALALGDHILPRSEVVGGVLEEVGEVELHRHALYGRPDGGSDALGAGTRPGGGRRAPVSSGHMAPSTSRSFSSPTPAEARALVTDPPDVGASGISPSNASH